MDPNACLARMRELTEEILQNEGANRADLGEELAALVYSLDEWITSGGFMPQAWAAPFLARALAPSVPRVPQQLAVGDRVRLHSGGGVGTVTRIAGVAAVVKWDDRLGPYLRNHPARELVLLEES